jgi:serine/threonine protein kinase
MGVSYFDTQEAEIGAWFGRYRVVQSIGEGGSAQIFLGQHVRSGQQVAIKVPRAQVKNAAYTLHSEAHLLGKLHHAHIIGMHMYGVQQNQPFLVLDYAPYGNLRHHYNLHQPLPFSRVLHFVEQISAALHYIHSKGLIHCDIKPENLLLLKPDHLVLSDFGIAVSEQALSTRKKPVGTIRYMAPEQLQGTPCRASDQYALAVLVFEWLNGKPPFTGTSLQIMQQHVSVAPPRLQRSIGVLSPSIGTVLKKALAKDPATRFSTVEEFFVALKESSRGFRVALSSPQRLKNERSAHYTTR